MSNIVKTKLYLHAGPNKYKFDDADDDIAYQIRAFEYIDDGEVVIATMDVEMKVPDIDVTDKFVENMRAQQEKIKAACSLQVDNLEGQIQSMLALPSPD